MLHIKMYIVLRLEREHSIIVIKNNITKHPKTTATPGCYVYQYFCQIAAKMWALAGTMAGVYFGEISAPSREVMQC